MLISTALVFALQAAAPDAALVTITVAGDAHYTRPHTITISPEGPGAETWVAVRTWEGGRQIQTSADCPAVNDAAQTFGELPPITVNPPILTESRGEPAPIGPFLLDGLGTSLSFETATSDGSLASVQLSGGTAYRLWAHETVKALIGCWGPLMP